MEEFASKYQTFLSERNVDTEYIALKESYEISQQELTAVLSCLDTKQQEVVHQYLGILAELQMREIELALAQK